MALNSRLVFNEAYYLAQNTDVKNAIGKVLDAAGTIFTSGLDHFNRAGAAEGRVATPLFDVDAYKANNPDLADAGLTTDAQLRAHFYAYGAAEGRNAMSSQVFNLEYYKAQNADLVNAGLSDAQIVRHFYEYGAAEGRVATVNFSVAAYKAANPDLVGLSDTVARAHWYTYGAGENRAFPQLPQSFTLTSSATQTAEGTAITYTITAALPVTADTSFTYNVSGDTNGGTIDAAVTADFAASSGTVTFAAGETSKTFTVTPSIDSTIEGLEGFKVTLFNSSFAVVGTKTGVILDNSQAVGTTQTLVSTNDALNGGAGNDTFNGVVSADNGSGTTLQAGDVLNGGSGTDTLNVSIAGTATAAVTTAAVTLTGVERISVSNFEASTNNNVIDLALVDSALTTLALSASSATGDTQFTNVGKVVAAEMSNGSGDLTITYTSTASAGATVQALTLANQTGGTFTANGVETLNIASNTLANTVTVAGDALATVNVTGAVALNLGTLPNTTTTLNASGLTAALTATLGTGTSVTVTGGSGDDVITTGAALTGGSVVGGSGADTLIVASNSHINTSTIGGRYTGFETLLLNGTVAGPGLAVDYTDRTQNVGFVSGITTYGVSSLKIEGDSGDNTANGTLGFSFTGATSGQTLSLSGISYTDSATDDSQGDDVALTVSSALATDGSADVINVALSGNSTVNTLTSFSAGPPVVSGDDLTLSLTLSNYETVNIASNGSSTNNILALDSSSLKSLVLTGSRAINIGSLTSNTATTVINASAATANVSVGLDGNASAAAMTITGGSGNDSFQGGSAADSIDGGTGNDSLLGAGGNDTIVGGVGNDVINGGAGIDSLSGGDGNDTFLVSTAGDFQGLTAAETIDGGSGDDTLKFSADMTLTGTDLTKVTSIEAFEFAGTGASSITLSNAYFTSAGVTAVTITDSNTGGALTVDASGLSAANSITVNADKGGANNDSLAGGSGNDTFKFTTATSATALTANDTVVGGAGTDTLAITLDTNNLTSVTLTGVSGIEKITVTGSGTLTAGLVLNAANFGGSVVGVIDASGMTGTGAFTLDGSPEGNSLSVTGGSGADNLTGGTSADTIIGGSGADTIVGGLGIDNLSGGAGDDVFTVATVTHFTGLTAAETVSGGDGNDILDFTEGAATSVSATDLLGISGIETIRFSGNNTASLTLTEQVLAANGVTTLKIVDNDTTEALTLSASTVSATYSLDVTAAGTSGKADNIVTGAGADIIRYNTINNAATLQADDTVDGGAGVDTLAITLNAGTSLTAVTLTKVANIEKITFTGTGAATASVTTADATFASVTGASIDGSGITGTGTLTFVASAEDDSTFNILGSLNNDTLTGGQLADTINGGAGADSITGGSGADSLTGGLGADVFVYTAVAHSTGSTADTITDFTSGTDTLQFTLDYSALSAAIDVNTNSVSSVADLSAKRGEFVYDSTAGTLSVNVNNDNLITTQDYKINVGSVAASDLKFVITGTAFGDSIVGGSGADSIIGGSGADTLTGGSGADTIVGGVGSDTISLGGADSARDVVSYTSTTAANLALEGSDSITGFQTAATRDIINFASGALVNGTNNGYANLTATNGTVGTNDVIVTLGGGSFTSTADLTVNATALAIIDALDTSNIANGDTVLFLLDNGTNVYAWLFTETATNTGTVDTAELTLLGTLNGIADAGSFSGQAATITTLAAAAATDYFSIG